MVTTYKDVVVIAHFDVMVIASGLVLKVIDGRGVRGDCTLV